jgi:hypothetical protein
MFRPEHEARYGIRNSGARSESVAVGRALDEAIGLCGSVIAANDERLGPLVERHMQARPTPQRLRFIRLDFGEIQARLRLFTVENFLRDAGSNCYAYVYPDRDNRIYLGDDFFTAPLTGRDSMAGSLIHEVSHFRSVRGTEDHAYGDDVEELNFARARNNANSFEYIAEEF